jgi:hypothetical protein
LELGEVRGPEPDEGNLPPDWALVMIEVCVSKYAGNEVRKICRTNGMKEVDIRLKKEGGERRERIGDKGSEERGGVFIADPSRLVAGDSSGAESHESLSRQRRETPDLAAVRQGTYNPVNQILNSIQNVQR